MSKEKKKDLNQRKNFKHYILLGIILIVPLLFFLWAGYISISSIGASLNTILELTSEDATKIISILNNTWHVFKIMAYEYIIYCIFLLILYQIWFKMEHFIITI